MKALHKYITEGYSGAGLILTCRGKVLFQLRRHPRCWAFIGGGINPSVDHDFLDCAIREVFEESGITVDRNSDSSCYLLLAVHHIIVDGWCTDVYMNDFKQFLQEARSSVTSMSVMPGFH